LFVDLKVYAPVRIRIPRKKYMYTNRKIKYRTYIVHANPALRSPGRLRTQYTKTCQSPLIVGGNPPDGTTSLGIIPVREDVVGMMTPGWVRKTIKNVSAYP
jgi:hypothetical protein